MGQERKAKGSGEAVTAMYGQPQPLKNVSIL